MSKAIFFLTLLVVTLITVPLQAKDIWKITSLNWEPYSGDAMTHQGNSIQKLRAILNAEGVKLVVEFYPWLRAKEVARKKGYIGYFPAWPEEVIEGFVGSKPIDWSEVAVMKRGDTQVEYNSIDKLFEVYSIGLVKTYIYPEIIDSRIQKYTKNIEWSSNEYSLLKMLASGRSHVAITDPSVMLYLSEKEGISDIEVLTVLMEKELVIAFRNDEENLKKLKWLNNFLIKLQN
ncbi:transporter substrate-binding domain-containing protein [Zooshikella marina]|uniref:substrate-binding periplasmic protein n=1 Tax=Zooshikella ganghwensis TaxID=202772 RepID=UPI001BAFB56B|nr:transporter substrate-binding domain-containing protein [Zooshikella ganghwensis]MBU2707232.1 transporter substrate-binding domain-containing protein [Zooshikella ganghwensis]